ncbi:MAG: phosphoribosylanthranilate isomerase [Cyclobacteriaceae bacterium]
MIIKVCGMAVPNNIRGLLNLGLIDWMGMIFYPQSKGYLPSFGFSPEDYLSINIPKVGVFVNADFKDIEEKVKQYGLQMVQLHGDESVELVKQVKDRLGVEVIKVFRIGGHWDWKVLLPYENWVDRFLFDTDGPTYGGTGSRFNWEILKKYTLNKPFILSGGIDKDSISAILDCYRKKPTMEGIDINSKFEFQPGKKNLEMIHQFSSQIKAALSEDTRLK